MTTAVFLEINGTAVTHVSNDEVYDFVMAVTTGRQELTEIAAELRSVVET